MPDELARLYDQHADALCAFLRGVTRHEADTRDTLKEVFLKLARRPALLADARDDRAFLLRLAHNAARDLFRRRETRAQKVRTLILQRYIRRSLAPRKQYRRRRKSRLVGIGC